jgi:hypothetical protein
MKSQLAVLTLLVAVAAPTLSYADDQRWESLRVYALPGGNMVAVAVPSEWEALDHGPALDKRPLRFRDAAGAEVAIPAAGLARASKEKRVFRPDLTEKVACDER